MTFHKSSLEMEDCFSRLSRLLCLALRHHPEQFGIRLDAFGWTELCPVLESLREKTGFFELDDSLVLRLVEEDPVSRFAIEEGRIRALYGHSVSNICPGLPSLAPPLLFHATRVANLPSIKLSGLNPGVRAHVHLTSSLAYAARIKSSFERRRLPAIILAVETHSTAEPFYRATEIVWTTKRVRPDALHLPFPDSSPAGFKLLPLLGDFLLTSGEEMASLERLAEA